MSEITNCDKAVEIIKTAIQQSQYDAARSVNEKQLMLYYGIGKYISLNSRRGFWGKGAIDAIGERLDRELPGLKGFSARNLRNMRTFYEEWVSLDHMRDEELNLADASAKTVPSSALQIWQTPVPNSQVISTEDFLHIGFSHHILILSKVKSTEERAFYIHHTVGEKLSVEALKASIARDDYHHQGSLPNNLMRTLPAAEQAFRAINTFKDEYLPDCINVEELGIRDRRDVDERVMENAVIHGEALRASKTSRFHTKRFAALLLCFILTAAFMLPMSACAQSTPKAVRVGWYESPFNMMDASGRRSGYAYEYQQKIAAYTGWTYEYVDGSWPELYQMLVNGEIDLMSDVSYTPDRAKQMLFPNLSMGAEEYYIFIAPGNTGIRQDDPRTLNGKRIGVNKGSIQIGLYHEWAEQYGVQAELIELTGSDSEAMQMVLSGDLDAYLTLDAYGGLDSAIPVFKVGSSDFFFAVNTERPDLLDALNSAMNSIQAENRYFTQQLSQKYIVTYGANLFLGADEISWLEQRAGVIRVGYQDNFLAFCAAEQGTGELTGALKDYLEYAAACFSNAHIQYEAIAYPTAAAAMDALKNGEVDCMFPANLSTTDGERLGFVMTPAILSTDIYTLIRKEDRDTFPTKEQVTAAIEENNPNYEAIMLDHFPEWQSEQFPDMQACIKAVENRKADCVLISNYQYNSLAGLCERYDLIPLITGEDTDFYFAVNLGNNALYSILTRTTNLVSDTTTYAALSYYSSDSSEVTLGDFIRHNPVLVGAVLVAILALIAIIIVQYRLIAARKEADESRHKVEDLNKQVFVDALTHVRNKGAYEQWAEKINGAIQRGEQEPFAIVVCDINNLKAVNDQYGHREGDACIQNACSKICGVFSHSPVFRVGGDEFVVFLSGVDFYQRKELMAQINAIPKDLSKTRIGETISAGMAEYRKGRHASILSVFEDADKAMYERKQRLKALGLSKDDRPDGSSEPEFIPVIHARKHILIVDDQEMNREILSDLLEDDYEISCATDGVQALEMLHGNRDEIDLVLLDLLMPNKSGRDVLAEMQVDEDLMSIPVIVLTVDQESELDCLKIGAMDFIPKPYPDIDIVKARIAKCIELSEDRELIRYTERDKLTGLLNKDYFIRYVGRLDHLYKDTTLDAVVCDVNRFHSVNKQYGRQFGDQILRSIGSGLKHLARETGGIVCREAGDTFLLYCPHQDNYEQMFRDFLPNAFDGKETDDRISLRFGVFADAGQESDIDERFERAKIAADRVKDDPEKICGFYDLK